MEQRRILAMTTIALAAVLLTSTGVVRAQEEQSSGPDWNNICNQVQSLLVQSCGDLVNSDGTLTQSGDTAVGCIRNGVVLGLGALAITPLSLPLIIDGLKALSVPTGCGNIVNWDAANLDQLNFLKNVIR
jgi:hypothetical protein